LFEFSGTVIGLSPKVDHFNIGDRIFGAGDMTRDGCWAERVAVDSRIPVRLPDKLSFHKAASLPIGALTAWEALFRDQETLPTGVERLNGRTAQGADLRRLVGQCARLEECASTVLYPGQSIAMI
jgi:NADPH:quinone reductase-like Zn-dependent oxidoreductase